MKKCVLAVLLFCFSITLGFSQEKSRVAVFPPQNNTDDSQYDIVGEAMRDSIILTLRLIGNYDVVPLEAPSLTFSHNQLESYAAENRIDSIVFGNTSIADNGAIVFEFSVFDAQNNQISVRESDRAESIFDVFDASDRLVVSLIDGIAGFHVGYGNLLLLSLGEFGNYRVYIDGIMAGNNKDNFNSMVAGTHTVRIEQDRPLGTYVVKEETIQVVEADAVQMGFEIPGITEEENDQIVSLFENAKEVEESDPDAARELVTEAAALIGNTQASQSLQSLRRDIEQFALSLPEVPSIALSPEVAVPDTEGSSVDSGRKDKPEDEEPAEKTDFAIKEPEGPLGPPHFEDLPSNQLDDFYASANAGNALLLYGPEVKFGIKAVDFERFSVYGELFYSNPAVGIIMPIFIAATDSGNMISQIGLSPESFQAGVKFVLYADEPSRFSDKFYYALKASYAQMVITTGYDMSIIPRLVLFGAEWGNRWYLWNDVFFELGGGLESLLLVNQNFGNTIKEFQMFLPFPSGSLALTFGFEFDAEGEDDIPEKYSDEMDTSIKTDNIDDYYIAVDAGGLLGFGPELRNGFRIAYDLSGSLFFETIVKYLPGSLLNQLGDYVSTSFESFANFSSQGAETSLSAASLAYGIGLRWYSNTALSGIKTYLGTSLLMGYAASDYNNRDYNFREKQFLVSNLSFGSRFYFDEVLFLEAGGKLHARFDFNEYTHNTSALPVYQYTNDFLPVYVLFEPELAFGADLGMSPEEEASWAAEVDEENIRRKASGEGSNFTGPMYALFNAGGLMGVGPAAEVGFEFITGGYFAFGFTAAGLGMATQGLSAAFGGGYMMPESFELYAKMKGYFKPEGTRSMPYMSLSAGYLYGIMNNFEAYTDEATLEYIGDPLMRAHAVTMYLGGGYRNYLDRNWFLEFGGDLGFMISASSINYSRSGAFNDVGSAGGFYPIFTTEINIGYDVESPFSPGYYEALEKAETGYRSGETEDLDTIYVYANPGGFGGLGPDIGFGYEFFENFYVAYFFKAFGYGYAYKLVQENITNNQVDTGSWGIGGRLRYYFDMEDSSDKAYVSGTLMYLHTYLDLVEDEFNPSWTDPYNELSWLVPQMGGGYRWYTAPDWFIEFGGSIGFGVSINNYFYDRDNPNNNYSSNYVNIYPMGDIDLSIGFEF